MIKFLSLIVATTFSVALATAQDASFLSRPSPFAGTTLLSLATFDEVRKEINLSSADKAQVDVLVEKFVSDISQDFKKNEDDFEAGQRGLDKLAIDYDDKLQLVLSNPEKARLRELYIQYNGVLAVIRPGLAQELELTSGQKSELALLQSGEHHKFKELLDQSLPMQAAQDQMRQNRDDYAAAVRKVLTTEQREKLKSLAGAHFEFEKVSS